MSDHASERGWQDSPDDERPNYEPEGVGSIEAYEEEDAIVLYDARNPLAWVEATEAVTLREYA